MGGRRRDAADASLATQVADLGDAEVPRVPLEQIAGRARQDAACLYGTEG